MITTLPDGTTVWVKWSNQDPNNPGAQHTNGPPKVWVRFGGNTKWYGSAMRESTSKLSAAIATSLSKQEVLNLLDITET